MTARRDTLFGMVAAALGGGLLALCAWFVFHQVTLPAFNTSMVTRALGAAGSTAVLIVAAIFRRRAIVTYLAPAALTVTALGVPLAATRLYLEGLQVDQGFRTQFLTRMTATAHLADMNYQGVPTYYPAGWFWLGGRLANLLGLQGWEAFQPWALVSLAAAGSMLVPVWRHLTGSLPWATAIALTTTAVVLTLCPEEPYAAVVAMGAPAAVMLSQRAFAGSWWATAGVAVYLGLSATHYTLYTGVVALTMVVLALLHRKPLQLAAMGFGSMAIAALSWGPYVLAVLTGHPHSGATASHYLPVESTTTPIFITSLNLVGVLSILALITMVVAWRNVRTMAIGLLCFYAWMLLSMLVTLGGTTLLGFRMEPVLAAQITTIGLLGLSQWNGLNHKALAMVFLTVFGIHYVQHIPQANQTFIDLAYSETDGNGERADRFPANTGKYYARIREVIGREPTDTVVLSDETNFFSTAPYYGFQAFTSHYANPLGEFDKRNQAIEQWAQLSWDHPEQLRAAMHDTAWRAPDALIFRGDVHSTEGWKLHIAEDIYPNQPNVRYEGLFFNPAAFADWTINQVGPFVVVS